MISLPLVYTMLDKQDKQDTQDKHGTKLYHLVFRLHRNASVISIKIKCFHNQDKQKTLP